MSVLEKLKKMNPKKKILQGTPIKKCRTKLFDGGLRKNIQGNFNLTISIKDICDETSSMEGGSSWNTLSEEGKSTGIIEDVFASDRSSGTEEDVLSSPEIFRRSEGHHDEWSLNHLFEDSDGSPERGYETHKRGLLCSTRIDSPKMFPFPPRSEDWDKISSISSIPCATSHSTKDMLFKCSKKIPFPEVERKNPSEIEEIRHDLHKKNSIKIPLELEEVEKTAILHPENFTLSGESREILQDNEESSCQANKSLLYKAPKNVAVKKNLKKKVLQFEKLRPKKTRKTVSQKRKNTPKPRTNNLTIFKRQSPDIPLDVEVDLSKISHPASLTPSSKSKGTLQTNEGSLCQDNEKGDLYEASKNILSKNISEKINLPEVERKKASDVIKIRQDLQKENSIEIPLEAVEPSKISHPGSLTPSSKRNKTLQANAGSFSQANKKGDVYETPKNVAVKKNLKKKVLQFEKLRQNTKQKSVLSKRKNTSKRNQAVFEKRSNDILPLTTLSEHPVEHMYNSESEENIRDPSLRISEENAGADIDEGERSKKTAAAKLKKKKNTKKKQSNEDALDEENVSRVISSGSTKDFLVLTKSRESITSPFSGILERMGGKRTKKSTASKLVKRRISPKERIYNEDSLEEEIVSTPDSTILSKDSIEYMDTTEFENSVSSEASKEKFLEEIGMLESETSSVKSQSSELVERKNNAEKKKMLNSWEGKRISEKIREYEEFLKTISFCDLSLKKRRIEYAKHKD